MIYKVLFFVSIFAFPLLAFEEADPLLFRDSGFLFSKGLEQHTVSVGFVDNCAKIIDEVEVEKNKTRFQSWKSNF